MKVLNDTLGGENAPNPVAANTPLHEQSYSYGMLMNVMNTVDIGELYSADIDSHRFILYSQKYHSHLSRGL